MNITIKLLLAILLLAILLATGLTIGKLSMEFGSAVQDTTYYIYLERQDIDWAKVTPEYRLIHEREMTANERSLY